uniref:Uncharacterized protein n=1 Tax=Steinernema glaseri TaxID=37863 RepID=A0A1I7ZNU2_9BILA
MVASSHWHSVQLLPASPPPVGLFLQVSRGITALWEQISNLSKLNRFTSSAIHEALEGVPIAMPRAYLRGSSERYERKRTSVELPLRHSKGFPEAGVVLRATVAPGVYFRAFLFRLF